jgi:hypothetical protein
MGNNDQQIMDQLVGLMFVRLDDLGSMWIICFILVSLDNWVISQSLDNLSSFRVF